MVVGRLLVGSAAVQDLCIVCRYVAQSRMIGSVGMRRND